MHYSISVHIVKTQSMHNTKDCDTLLPCNTLTLRYIRSQVRLDPFTFTFRTTFCLYCVALHCNTIQCLTIRHYVMHDITLHCTASHYPTMHHITANDFTLHCTAIRQKLIAFNLPVRCHWHAHLHVRLHCTWICIWRWCLNCFVLHCIGIGVGVGVGHLHSHLHMYEYLPLLCVASHCVVIHCGALRCI